MSEFGPSKAGTGAISPAALERARSYAKDVMRQGMPAAKVEEVLRAQGFDAAAASAIVAEADRTKDERRIAGRRGMIIGAVISGIGIAFTAGTYIAATNNGGGTYVVWWGLIAVGAIQFFRGLNQMTDK
jgi:hypothetical protein